MKLRNILFAMLAAVILYGCKPKCQIECTVGAVPTAIGYTFGELDTVIINGYKQDNTFSSLLVSDTMYNHGYINLPQWTVPGTYSGYDTVGDTLGFEPTGTYFFDDYASTTLPYDIEIIVRSNNNKSYRFTNITLASNQSEEVYCPEGSPNPSNCGRYISSYLLNGNKVTGTGGRLYFQK
jgi:hypothetical protein